MGEVHLFNPENDSALAVDSPGYTPSRAARQMQLDGSLLPLWWAREGDIVLSPRVAEGEQLKRRFGLHADVKGVVTDRVDSCRPWGWSRYAASMLGKAGVTEKNLPSREILERIRNLSHRRVSIAINSRLREMFPEALFPPQPKEIDDIDQLYEVNGPVYAKLPWSSSGRGVLYFERMDEPAREEIAGMIARQGSVLIEPALDRVADFAALFHSDGHKVDYRGLSLFYTDRTGAYTGNLLASEEYLSQELSKHCDVAFVRNIATALELILTDIVSPAYSGWLGVDMMVYRDGNRDVGIAPCVELNLRMTMGVVAHLMRCNPHIECMLPSVFTVGRGEREGLDVGGASCESVFRFSVRRI